MREGKSNDPFSEVRVTVDPPHWLLYSFISSSLKHKFIEIQFCVWLCQRGFPALWKWDSYRTGDLLARNNYLNFFLLKNVFSLCMCVHLCTLVEDNLEDLKVKFRLSGSEVLSPWAISPALALLFERMPASSSLAYSEHSPVHLGIVGRVIDLDILWWGRGLDLAPFMKDKEHKTDCVFKQHNMGKRAKRNAQKIGGS